MEEIILIMCCIVYMHECFFFVSFFHEAGFRFETCIAELQNYSSLRPGYYGLLAAPTMGLGDFCLKKG